jgi:hypothetical protein
MNLSKPRRYTPARRGSPRQGPRGPHDRRLPERHRPLRSTADDHGDYTRDMVRIARNYMRLAILYRT